jgi:predicted RNase H-like nuclease
VSTDGRGRLKRGPELPYRVLAGITPIRAGWLVASGKLVGIQLFPEEPRISATFRSLLDEIPQIDVIAVNSPIGLPTAAPRGGRGADKEARSVLGFPHAGAIGTAPVRRSLACRGYDEARRRNGGQLDIVTWQLYDKIRELDDEMEPYLQRRVFEVRSELSFLQLNEDQPMRYAKVARGGRKERLDLLRRRMPGVDRILNADVKATGAALADAAACLWTARRIAARAAHRLPADPEWDDKGLRMEIVY